MILKSIVAMSLVFLSLSASARVGTRSEVILFCDAIIELINDTKGVRELNEAGCLRANIDSTMDRGDILLEGVVQIRIGYEEDGNDYIDHNCRLKYRGAPQLDHVLANSVVCSQ